MNGIVNTVEVIILVNLVGLKRHRRALSIKVLKCEQNFLQSCNI